MTAEVTENNELVLRWLGDRRNEIKWVACSDNEFEVIAKLWYPGLLNYQGATTVEFSTTCYARALECFANSLEQFAEHHQIQAKYGGSEDMYITILSRRGQADYRHLSAVCCDLEYNALSSVGGIACENRLFLTLGACEDVMGTIEAIRRVLRNLGMEGMDDW
jgi:hypothetical protein